MRRGTISEERRAVAMLDTVLGPVDGDVRKFTGRAIVFGEWAMIGDARRSGFRERIMPGALDKTLRETDTVLLVGHDPNMPVSRVSAGSLRLSADEEALHVDSDLDLRVSYVNDLAINVENRIVKGMSFGFRVPEGKEEWRTGADGVDERTVREIAMPEITATAFPAYTGTDADVRSAVFAARIRSGNLTAADARKIRGDELRSLQEIAVDLRRAVAEKRMTANDTFASLNEAVTEACSPDNGFAYVEDYDDTYVYFTVYDWSDNDQDMYRQGYTLAADGMATLTGTAEQVRRRATYAPVTDPDDSSEPPSGTRSRDTEPPGGTRAEVALLKLRMKGLKALHSF